LSKPLYSFRIESIPPFGSLEKLPQILGIGQGRPCEDHLNHTSNIRGRSSTASESIIISNGMDTIKAGTHATARNFSYYRDASNSHDINMAWAPAMARMPATAWNIDTCYSRDDNNVMDTSKSMDTRKSWHTSYRQAHQKWHGHQERMDTTKSIDTSNSRNSSNSKEHIHQ
jgi:hypothetical protein